MISDATSTSNEPTNRPKAGRGTSGNGRRRGSTVSGNVISASGCNKSPSGPKPPHVDDADKGAAMGCFANLFTPDIYLNMTGVREYEVSRGEVGFVNATPLQYLSVRCAGNSGIPGCFVGRVNETGAVKAIRSRRPE